MHFAEAGDARGAEWALRAAAAARAVDAHVEAMAQLERALTFELEPERRRGALAQAAMEAYDLGRYDAILAFVREALSIPGGGPETLAGLHQQAARAARALGDLAADEAHLAAAERLLEALPPGRSAASLAVARVARAAVDARPEQLAAASERALGLAAALEDAGTAAVVRAQVKSFLVVSRLNAGDPSAAELLHDALALAAAHGLPGGFAATALTNAYAESVVSLFHGEAQQLYSRAGDAFSAHDLDWLSRIEPYRVLALIQRGRYEEARALVTAIEPPAVGALEHAVLLCATALGEVRAGSIERAQSLVGQAPSVAAFQPRALLDLARLEVSLHSDDRGLGDLARAVYDEMNRRHHARIAGLAAVCLARSGRGAPPAPDWLVAESPLQVLWDWAAGIERPDAAALRDVAARLEAMDCPFDAALAQGDAGDLGEAYRALRALGATTARERLAARLRAAGEPVPRRSRAAVARDSLSEAERALCRLVAAGARNEAIADELNVSLRTVEAYLGRIYAKTGVRGKAALAAWWVQQQAG